MVTGLEREIVKELIDPKAVARAIEGIDKMASHVKEIEKRVSGNLGITTKTIEISCPENIEVYSWYIRPKAGLINNDIRFKAGNIINATITAVEGFTNVPSAIKVPDEHGGATVHLRELEANALYSLRLTYKIENDKFLDDLVFMKRQIDSENRNTEGDYWMTAGLKCPEAFWKQQGYSRIDINDMNFSVDVNINNEINTAIPKAYIYW